MPGEDATTGPIAVYGATGFTGRLVAAELRRRGARTVLSGRNPAKLEILAEEIGGDVEVRPARLEDGRALHELLEPCAAVISCAGPFVRHGEPVLAAAVEGGTHYLDTTGEQPFMRKVFDVYGRRAEEAGVALVTAMGFDYVPGDMIAALTATGPGPYDDIVLAYSVKDFGPTRGTALSAVGMLAGGDVEWRDGRLAPASQRVGRGTWDFGDDIGAPMDGAVSGRRAPHGAQARRDESGHDAAQRLGLGTRAGAGRRARDDPGTASPSDPHPPRRGVPDPPAPRGAEPRESAPQPLCDRLRGPRRRGDHARDGLGI
jgi:hypothetical protein